MVFSFIQPDEEATKRKKKKKENVKKSHLSKMKIGCFMLGGKYPKIKLKMYITALL